jgi:hypothetical protein
MDVRRKPSANNGGPYIRRGKPTKNFTTLPNTLLQDRALALIDIGLMVNVLSRTEDWCARISELSNGEVREGRERLRGSLRRLRQRGYLSLIRERNFDGTLRSVYVAFSDPRENDLPDIAYRSTASRTPVSRPPVIQPLAAQPSATRTPYKKLEEKEQTEEELTEKGLKQKEPPPPPSSPADNKSREEVVALLRGLGMDEANVIDCAKNFPRDRINDAIETMRNREAKGKCDSPAGFIYEMLKRKWTVPKAVIEQRRKKLVAVKNADVLRTEAAQRLAERDRLTAEEPRFFIQQRDTDSVDWGSLKRGMPEFFWSRNVHLVTPRGWHHCHYCYTIREPMASSRTVTDPISSLHQTGR